MKPTHRDLLEKLCQLPTAPEIVLRMADAVAALWGPSASGDDVIKEYIFDRTKQYGGYKVNSAFLATDLGVDVTFDLANAIAQNRKTCSPPACDGKCIRDVLNKYFGVHNLVPTAT